MVSFDWPRGKILSEPRSHFQLRGKRPHVSWNSTSAIRAQSRAALHQLGFRAGGTGWPFCFQMNLSILELIYAWQPALGIIAVPINTRYSAQEIDRVLTDSESSWLGYATPPCRNQRCALAWQRILDKKNPSKSHPGPVLKYFMTPEAVFDPYL